MALSMRPEAPYLSPAEERRRLQHLAQRDRTSLATLSRVIGRHDGYVSRYLRGETPRRLIDDDRRRLARFYGVDEYDLATPVH